MGVDVRLVLGVSKENFADAATFEAGLVDTGSSFLDTEVVEGLGKTNFTLEVDGD